MKQGELTGTWTGQGARARVVPEGELPTHRLDVALTRIDIALASVELPRAQLRGEPMPGVLFVHATSEDQGQGALGRAPGLITCLAPKQEGLEARVEMVHVGIGGASVRALGCYGVEAGVLPRPPLKLTSADLPSRQPRNVIYEDAPLRVLDEVLKAPAPGEVHATAIVRLSSLPAAQATRPASETTEDTTVWVEQDEHGVAMRIQYLQRTSEVLDGVAWRQLAVASLIRR